jgi:hypothetical protein
MTSNDKVDILITRLFFIIVDDVPIICFCRKNMKKQFEIDSPFFVFRTWFLDGKNKALHRSYHKQK